MKNNIPEPAYPPLHPSRWLPNALTIGRILFTPMLIWLISGTSAAASGDVTAIKWAAGLFALCAVTDFLDGHLARFWGAQSDFGRMIDPIADKILVAGCLIAINLSTVAHHGILWQVLIPSLIIIGRDILVSGVREHAAFLNIVMAPTRPAKLKTTLEMLAIFLFLLAMAWTGGEALAGDAAGSPPVLAMIAGIVLWLAAVLSAWTGGLYFRAALSKKAT
ncbi:MAG: CDP-diacylglycerol--glycerol-3-phosphate 3-phosphatidyltransferase [Hyphomonadaceae bacterium]|nr:CDP-diacylglycerol--glycerol-3-phosphate 3-phosphatidyltransferase [Hyphomonadaceae bacterium]MBC6412527.1 CDP-diacylglycerol--glycerol-3-phosphate 3-phosphatidyltransferase [Hyphomonadaceae bacterium]